MSSQPPHGPALDVTVVYSPGALRVPHFNSIAFSAVSSAALPPPRLSSIRRRPPMTQVPCGHIARSPHAPKGPPNASVGSSSTRHGCGGSLRLVGS